MRRRGFIGGVLLILAATTPLAAQTTTTSSTGLPTFYQGGTPQNWSFKPFDTSKVSKTFDLSKTFFNAPSPTAPNLSKYSPSFSNLTKTWPPPGTIQRPILTGSNNMFQPAPPSGISFFNQPAGR